MNKVLAKSLALATATMMATPSTQATGFYVGAAVGGAALTGDSRLTVARTDPALVAPETRFFALDMSDKSFAGDLFIGYGKPINNLYLGVELVGSISPIKSKKSMDISGPAGEAGETLTLKTNNALGASVNIGYLTSPTSKLYVRVGFESRRFSLNFVSPTLVGPYMGLNKSYRSTAFVPGLGLEVNLTPRLAVRTEYRIALHGKSHEFHANDPADATRFTVVQTKPTLHYFNVGLVFKM